MAPPENDDVAYRDGREEMRRGRVEEVRDPGPHAVYRIRNERTSEIQVITQGQREAEAPEAG
ncbi:hypothetical protein [Streptomyces antarcticus]|uniref:hypothetical protein n=1 Tax=Streptomyces antarcticus TaxID=2996458 RepID=UPI00226FD3B6|nr:MULTISPECIES: hypothetical protein [unclassified Streptomyces]MCY0946106.1 hypothetical protein [Streptomyces sp. H34-AA3]MCZ4081098.1 hypothetical protein [Streptomyces sp. H34-S5]